MRGGGLQRTPENRESTLDADTVSQIVCDVLLDYSTVYASTGRWVILWYTFTGLLTGLVN